MRRVLGLFIAGLLSPACGDRPPETVGSIAGGLTAEQCDYPEFWDNRGKIRICHYNTKLKKKKFEVQKVSPADCKSHISAHAIGFPDYVAYDDQDCSGDGCLPIAAPCDPTVPCCEGLVCADANGVSAAVGHCVEVDACVHHACGANETCADEAWPADDDEDGRVCDCAPGFAWSCDATHHDDPDDHECDHDDGDHDDGEHDDGEHDDGDHDDGDHDSGRDNGHGDDDSHHGGRHRHHRHPHAGCACAPIDACPTSAPVDCANAACAARACDDGDACTSGDICQAGACRGTDIAGCRAPALTACALAMTSSPLNTAPHTFKASFTMDLANAAQLTFDAPLYLTLGFESVGAFPEPSMTFIAPTVTPDGAGHFTMPLERDLKVAAGKGGSPTSVYVVSGYARTTAIDALGRRVSLHCFTHELSLLLVNPEK